jgi:ABC-type Fe3+-hydroxamate transport system substrate-binding protein
MTGYLAEMRDTRKISGKAKKHKKIATSIKDKVEELENEFVKQTKRLKN